MRVRIPKKLASTPQPHEMLSFAPQLKSRATILRELLIFMAFAGLTVVMTWPWARDIRATTSDAGDPYLNSWILWWDYHQTFHDPLNLFHANIFYPYRYTLAFSEHNYGIALLFFPLFALGVRPLTVHGLAVLLGFTFSGYGAFRLTRTMTGSNGAAWIAGLAFAFVPYRFNQLSHVNYIFAGWIPILLESLVLFTRERSRARAAWLGIAFFMNGLTCIHWLVFTLIPMAFAAMVLVMRHGLARDTRFWKRGGVALGAAALALVPFLYPYTRAAHLYGFVRTYEETLYYSALPLNWIAIESRNKLWGAFLALNRGDERALFPGLVPILLALVAIFLVKGRSATPRNPANDVTAANHQAIAQPQVALPAFLRRIAVIVLDATILGCALIALMAAGHGGFRISLGGVELLRAQNATRTFDFLLVALFIRLAVAYPAALRFARARSLIETLSLSRRADAFLIGMIWIVIGFLGSFGVNFSLHRLLFQYVPLFRSIRVPARWSMICYLGLSIVAGIGAKCLVERLDWIPQRRLLAASLYLSIALVLLFEQRAAPLSLIRGAVDPDELTMRLARTPMRGGIVELPAETGGPNYTYTLRAADHARPLITAVSGFEPPIELEIQALTHRRYIPDSFLDLMEQIPASYLVVHNSLLAPQDRRSIEALVSRMMKDGRLRFIRSFGSERSSDELYAVTKSEPAAETEAPLPAWHARPSMPAGPAEDSIETESLTPDGRDDARRFVTAQYNEFLHREPDPAGLKAWIEYIDACAATDYQCQVDRRIATSAAFFRSPEFFGTGFFLIRLYRTTLFPEEQGEVPVHPTFLEFVRDIGAMRSGVTGDELKGSQLRFAREWVRRPEFRAMYDSDRSAGEFVDHLARVAHVSLSAAERDRMLNLPRAEIVSEIVNNPQVAKREYNSAFVTMEYFGYLKRDPDKAGYAAWLDYLGEKPGNCAVMISGFAFSREYRERFGSSGDEARLPPVSEDAALCGQ